VGEIVNGPCCQELRERDTPSAGCRPRRARSSGCKFSACSAARFSLAQRAKWSRSCSSDLPSFS